MPLPQDSKNTIISGLNTSLAVVKEKLDTMGEDVKDIKSKLESQYATREWVDSKYGQTKKQVDAIIWIIVSAVVVALVSLVVINNK